jgi:hypothetical protein
LILATLAGSGHCAFGRERTAAAPFKFAGGTANLPEGCQGALEVGAEAMTFKCSGGSVSVPYSAITLMQYRPDISRKIWKMKIKWQVKPPSVAPLVGGKKNRFFTVLYEEHGVKRGLVLDVPPLTMRPYLAEIDVKAGKRVEVKEYEEYD